MPVGWASVIVRVVMGGTYQQNKLKCTLRDKLRDARREKLTKVREPWQAHMKNWPSLLKS
jgi:hypothetical protein